jgi:hypothetical protein
MSERLHGGEFEPATAIAEVIHDWLQAEIESSMSGRNHVLDDWDKFQQDLRLPFNDPRNQDGQKIRSHHNRLHLWTLMPEQYDHLTTDDKFLAQQTWAALMMVSGAFRKQCFIQSYGQNSYEQRRREQGPAGINIADTVQRRLDEYDRNMELPRFGIRGFHDSQWSMLQDQTLRINDDWLGASKAVHDLALRATEPPTMTYVPLLEMLEHAQRDWTRLAADYMVFSAVQRDSGWAGVPMLEPKSISEDPRIYRPFENIQ